MREMMGEAGEYGCAEGAAVSIVVPVYNVAPYVEECVESIRSQTYKKIEILLVDDGSTDGSGAICDEMAREDSRIRVIHQENSGTAAARGRGIAAASGEYITFVDGDDWVDADMVEGLLECLKGADLVFSGLYCQFSPNRTETRWDHFPEGYYDGERLEGLLKTMIYDEDTEILTRLPPRCCSRLFRSDLAKRVYVGVDRGMAYAEDSVFLYKYILRCRSLVVSHACFYHYRYREGSATHGVNKHMLEDINKAYLALEEDFRQHWLGERLVFQLQKWVAFLCCMAVNEHMGFDARASIPQFVADLSYLEGKRLVLYGAGRMGKDTWAQLRQFGYKAVLWVDKDYRFYQGQGLPVASPDEIAGCGYDLVLIAVSGEGLSEKIMGELSEKGIPRAKLIWKKPLRAY